jgi:hypothetical protein
MKDALKENLKTAMLSLLEEGYVGPRNAGGTWFVDNEPGAGILGTIGKLSAAQASRQPPGGLDTIAAHVNHLRFSLELANRAFRGENPYADADWSQSWTVREVNEQEWRDLSAALTSEYEKITETLHGEINLEESVVLTGTLALIAHGAWHLGALRQLMQLSEK